MDQFLGSSTEGLMRRKEMSLSQRKVRLVENSLYYREKPLVSNFDHDGTLKFDVAWQEPIDRFKIVFDYSNKISRFQYHIHFWMFVGTYLSLLTQGSRSRRLQQMKSLNYYFRWFSRRIQYFKRQSKTECTPMLFIVL